METKTNLSPLHCIFFIYQSFAYTTDGVLSDDEKKMIGNAMFRWTGSDEKKTNTIIQETLTWGQENIKTAKEQIESMISMIEFLKTQESFDLKKREYFLMDIRNIARSDGKFLDSEKKWHDMMSKQLGVGVKISEETDDVIEESLEKVEKRKIGFRR
jgi:hypothetical protein